jgi:hypothetical protein
MKGVKFQFSERTEKIKLAESVANQYFQMRDKLRYPTLPGFNTVVRQKSYFDYYTQLDLGWELNSTLIDKLSKKLGIADLREYIGIRK